MPLDRRLREDLDRLASAIEPDVESHLQASLNRARRRSRRRGVASALVFAAVVLGIVMIGPAVLETLRDGPSLVGSTSSPAELEPLRGRYTTTVASDDAAVQEHAMNGEWTIEYGDEGILDVTAPAAFSGTRTGYSFEVTGNQLRTDLFSADVCSGLLPGSYRWQLVDATLTLAVLDDACPGRAALLSEAPWRSISASE